MNDSLKNDKEYLERLGIRSFYPPNSIVFQALKRAKFESCNEQGPAREVLCREAEGSSWTRRVQPYKGPEDYLFVSLQSLAPVFLKLGYDIRPGMVDLDFEQVDYMSEAIAAKATAPRPVMTGALKVDGRMGLVVTREWLKSAGIKPQIARNWQSSVYSSLTDSKSGGAPNR